MSYPEALYHGTAGEISATYRPADQRPDLQIGQAVDVHYLATGASTGGRFGLYRWDAGPESGGAAPHFHRTMSESFFIVSGLRALRRTRVGRGPGGGLRPRPGGRDPRLSQQSAEPASMLILFAPGAPREGYFQAIAERVAGRHYTGEEWTAL